MKPNSLTNLNRRQFLIRATLTSGGIIATNLFSKSLAKAPAIITSDKMRPSIPYGVASGDINGKNGVIWSRSGSIWKNITTPEKSKVAPSKLIATQKS